MVPARKLPMESTQRRDRSRDKALLIAIEYKWPEFPGVDTLSSPHKDMERMRQHLISHWGYHPANITTLKDGPKGEVDDSMLPTRGNIFREIRNLVKGVQAGDRCVFFFAGHCYQIKNRRGTEWDGKDEVILTAKHKGPPDENINYALTDPIRQGLVIDNELRETLVNSMPCGAPLVAIADTCHSGTLFDLAWHWYFDTQDRLCTLPPLPSNDMHMAASSSCETFDSSPRHHSRTKIKSEASEYAYQFRDTPEGHRGASASSSMDHPQRMKTLFSKRTASWVPKEGNRTMSQDNTRRENRSNDHREWSNHTRAWGVSDICPSPTEEKIPEVTSLSSAQDDQRAWARSENDTMTSLLITIVEEFNHKPLPIQELTRLLKGRMQNARRQTMEAYYEGRKKIISEESIRILNAIQKPQLGGTRRSAKYGIFEL